jgi:hypothetical protein
VVLRFCRSKRLRARTRTTCNLGDIEKSLWVSWPKKSGGQQTDLGENDIRDIVLPTGWVDVKVAAIDDIWSGLKFLRRKA